MRITPLEIRQKTFERTLRGYDKDEVNGFLLSLSQEWERNIDETKDLRSKLETCEREIAKLREVETSLFKTLKTAEDTGANVVGQANKEAQLLLKEAQLQAEAVLNEARDKAKNTVEEADATSKQWLGEMEDNLKALVVQYKAIEAQRNNLIDDLKRLANEVMDRAERVKQTEFNADDHLNFAKREAKRSIYPNGEAKRLQVSQQSSKQNQEPEPMRSFFDEVA
ncbi:MAG TPA: DivIVA domain-containing protein [Cyclobacteriaceae bacterium]|nr:DivIVA domain-containing protein [Cyclobacteriaceae bacterium]